jgi:hypothetical protein
VKPNGPFSLQYSKRHRPTFWTWDWIVLVAVWFIVIVAYLFGKPMFDWWWRVLSRG